MRSNQSFVRNLFVYMALILAMVLCLPPQAAAQNDYLMQVGAPHTAAMLPVELGMVNLTNGNLHQEILLGSFRQRGNITYTAKLVYDSRIWEAKQWYPSYLPSYRPYNISDGHGNYSMGGWRLVVDTDSSEGFTGFTDQGGPCGDPYYLTDGYDARPTNFYWAGPAGESHTWQGLYTHKELGQHPCTGEDKPTASGFADDGSGFYLVVTNYFDTVVYAPDGTQVFPAFKDPNGNYFSQDAGGNVIDTLGRTPVVKTVSGSNIYYDVLNAQGGRSRYTVTTASIPVSVPNYSATLTVIQSVGLPNGTSYQFGYEAGTAGDNWGGLTSVTLPTGGLVSYGYTTFTDALDGSSDGSTRTNRWVSSHTSGGGIWSHTPKVTGPTNQQPRDQQMTVVKPDNGYTVYKFHANCSYGPFSTMESDSYGASGSLLRQELIDYTFGTCANGYGADAPPIPFRVTTVIPDGSGGTLTRKTEYDYTNSPSLGSPTKVSEWNYYSGAAPAAPDRIIQASYSITNPALAGRFIFNKPLQVTLSDGAGNQVAQTSFTYDDTTLVQTGACQSTTASQPSPAAPQHDYQGYCTSNATRGNLTHIATWLNTTNSSITTKTNTYDDTGNLITTADALGNTTTFSYGAGFGLAYVTKAQDALGHITTKNYDFNTGLPVSITDANNQVSGLSTTFSYDGMGRLTQTNLPDGGRVTTNFNGDAVPLTVTTTQLATPDPSIVSTTVMDGLGRTTSKCITGPQGDDCVDTTFDPTGRVSTVSNPHRSAAAPTDGVTTYQYDGLGRTIKTIDQDNSFSTTTYTGNCTLSADEAGKQRRGCADAFGRLIEVREPNPDSLPTAATGSVNISGSEQTTNATVTITVPNSGFETPALGAGNFQYNPGGGSWTFSGQTGLSANGSGFTSGNPGSPEGAQVAFIQSGWSTTFISQTLSGFQAGVSYTVSFLAAQRGNISQSGEDFDVYLDSTLLGTFRPGSTSYSAFSTGVFTTTAGSHTLKFAGRNTFTGDNTAFIDAVQVTGITGIGDTGTVTISVNGTPYTYNYGAGDNTGTIAAGLASTISSGSLATATSVVNSDVPVANSGFETPALGAGNFQYNSNGGSWTFSGQTGLSANNSGFTSGNPGAPEGGQVAFIQSGWPATFISQSLSGFQTGVSYTVNFLAAQRANFSQGGQDFDVFLDSTRLGTFRPGSTSYSALSTAAFTTTAGSHTLKFVGRNSATGDNTAFIDAVHVTAATGSTVVLTSNARGAAANYTLTASSTHSANFSQPSFIASPFGATLTGGLDSGDINNNPYVTQYSYDVLGNLLSVNQIGDGTAPRVRSFTYDSLSRLLTATNPESGTINYKKYDANGNLLQKESPAPNQLGSATQTISYCYDALSRVTGKAYSAQDCNNGQLPSGTAVVSYVYDQRANGIGHLSGLTDQAGTATYDYDIMGRLKTEQRTLSGSNGPVSKTVSYDYNLGGSLKALHYPSGAVVTYTPDAAGRTVSAVDTTNAASPINYVTGATYGPDGALTGFVSGITPSFTGITNTFVYNNRLQPCRMTASSTGAIPTTCLNSWGNLLDLSYDFHLGNGNNGNVWGITNYRDQTRNQTFTYDPLNRLATARNAGTDCSQTDLHGNKKFWGNTYVYDAWGNLRQKTSLNDPLNPTCAGEGLNVNVGNNNRISTAGYAYDAAGNLTNDPNGHAYTYDQENRITGAGGFTYTYDADGNRVEKANESTGTLYWYMMPGVVAESDLTGTLKSEYVFFSGERVARRDLGTPTGVFYYLSDHLKTASVVTDAIGDITAESDYYPWGGELQFVNTDSNHYKFTGKERDAESELDYFGARYYSNGLGRFITPDWAAKAAAVPYADFTDPQSLNLYTYVRNIPTSRTDPNGHCTADGEKHNWVWCAAHAVGLAETKKEHEVRIHQAAENMRQWWADHGVMLYQNGNHINPENISDQQVLDAARWYWQTYLSGDGEAEDTYSPAIAAAIINTAGQIASGHAWGKHQGEFPGWDQGKFRDTIKQTMQQPDEVRYLSNNRTAYWNAKENMVVIENPADPDGGTAFRPTNGKTYFDGLK